MNVVCPLIDEWLGLGGGSDAYVLFSPSACWLRVAWCGASPTLPRMDLLFDDDDRPQPPSTLNTTKVAAMCKKKPSASKTKRSKKAVIKVSTKATEKAKKDTSKKPATADHSSSVLRSIRSTMMDRAAHQAEIPPRSGLVEAGKLTLGSDCSGMGMDYLALKLVGLPLPIETAFCSEVDDNKKKMLEIMHEGSPIRTMYNDIAERNNSEAPEVDIFVSGAPCQAFSSAGKRLGAGEARGIVILHSLSYVIEKLPSVVVFENVAGLLHQKHKRVLQTLTRVLTRLGYSVSHKLVNTRDHGVPQSRPRVYIVGTSRGGRTKKMMEWPKAIQCFGAHHYLESSVKPDVLAPLTHLSPTAKRNVRVAKKKWSKKLKTSIDKACHKYMSSLLDVIAQDVGCLCCVCTWSVLRVIAVALVPVAGRWTGGLITSSLMPRPGSRLLHHSTGYALASPSPGAAATGST